MNMNKLLSVILCVISFGVAIGDSALAATKEVNLYSARKEKLIKPLLDRFTEQTGITVNLVTGNADALLVRLKSEGRNSPADLLITTDAGRLYRAKASGLTQALDSKRLDNSVSEAYRDPEGHWYGLSLRARTIIYAKQRVNPDQLSSYRDLADPKWKGKICIRSSNNIYNQSLVAAMIAHAGVEETEAWVKGLVRNLARPPRGGDRDQIKAVAAGQCEIAIANTYYLGTMTQAKQQAQREAAEKVSIFWPDQTGRGTHVNISGGAVTHWAKNPDNAVRLLEFLVSDQAQQWYAEVNFEYPVKPGIPWSPVLESWGRFKADDLNMAELGKHNAEAVRIMDRAGWK